MIAKLYFLCVNGVGLKLLRSRQAPAVTRASGHVFSQPASSAQASKRLKGLASCMSDMFQS